MELKFIRRGETSREFNQPELVRLTDERFAALAEKEGKFYAEIAYYLFMSRLHVSLHKDDKLANAASTNVARFVSAVVEEVYKDNSDDRMAELMKDVDAITEEVLLGVIDSAKKLASKMFGDKKEGEADHA